MSQAENIDKTTAFSSAELTALAHLYRGEMYRSKVWRNRLDTTTNWAVGTTGIALTITFTDATATPLPLLVIMLLVVVFLAIEARRYRYFDIWRTRVRVLEVYLYGPILLGRGPRTENGWNVHLQQDYYNLLFHISFWEAIGRRLRRNYLWIFLIIGASYLLKLFVHPTALLNLHDFWQRAAIGPLSGQSVIVGLAVFYLGLISIALLTVRAQQATGRVSARKGSDELAKLARSAAANQKIP
jgi:uncharacterized membrane protein